MSQTREDPSDQIAFKSSVRQTRKCKTHWKRYMEMTDKGRGPTEPVTQQRQLSLEQCVSYPPIQVKSHSTRQPLIYIIIKTRNLIRDCRWFASGGSDRSTAVVRTPIIPNTTPWEKPAGVCGDSSVSVFVSGISLVPLRGLTAQRGGLWQCSLPYY
eukprot:COSAG02_NODE_16_length_56207_cov_9.816122_27_plen_156_part_00